MALVAGSMPIVVTLTYQDLDGNKSTNSVPFPASFTVAQIQAELSAIEAAGAALSNANIIGGSITIPLKQEFPPAAPVESSDVERKGVFVFETEAGTSAKYEIPSIDPALVVNGTNAIDQTNVAVLAYINFMVNGWAGAANGPVTQAGISLTKLKSARKMHRGSSKG